MTSKSLFPDTHLHTQSKAQWQRLQRMHSNLLQGNNSDKVALQRRCLIGFCIYLSAPMIKCYKFCFSFFLLCSMTHLSYYSLSLAMQSTQYCADSSTSWWATEGYISEALPKVTMTALEGSTITGQCCKQHKSCIWCFKSKFYSVVNVFWL